MLDGYGGYQEAVFGAVPEGAFPRLTTQDITLKSAAIVEGLSSRTSIPISFTMTLANLTDKKNTFENAIGLYKNDELKEVVDTLDLITDLAANGIRTVTVSLNLDATIAKGAYQLRPISRAVGAEKWRWDGNYDKILTLGVNGDRATVTVGIPAVDGNIIAFADEETKRLCVENWDLNGDGELSMQEAADVKSLDKVFYMSDIKSFDELQYFTGLTVIGKSAFRWCKLSSLIIPSQVVSIEEYAFDSSRLQRITIPASVREITPNALINCQLEDIIVDKANTVFDSRNDCHALVETASNTLLKGCKNTIIPNGVEAIGENAFYTCSELTTITIPETVTSIGESAFEYCKSLTSVSLPESLTSIDDNGFANCSNLPDLYLPANITSIGAWSFSE